MYAIASCFLMLFSVLFAAFPGIGVDREITHDTASATSVSTSVALQQTRSSPGDLELSGTLAGLPAGSHRFLRYEDLLRLPLETYTVSDDSNFHGRTRITGVALSTLAGLFAAKDSMVAAVCYDSYQSNYPSEYIQAHHPVLVLKIDGKSRDQWPLSEYGGPLGPYLISHPPFKPSFTVLSHKDEAQIPFGVTRIEFGSEARIFGAIRPPGAWGKNSPVWMGYEIARQDCYRCHNMGTEGGFKAQRSWLILGAWAATDPALFQAYVHQPRSIMKSAQMPAHTDYDRATLAALTAYFRTFAARRMQR